MLNETIHAVASYLAQHETISNLELDAPGEYAHCPGAGEHIERSRSRHETDVGQMNVTNYQIKQLIAGWTGISVTIGNIMC